MADIGSQIVIFLAFAIMGLFTRKKYKEISKFFGWTAWVIFIIFAVIDLVVLV